MKHSLDHSTATEANGIIWELCSRCEAWVSQHDRNERQWGCTAPTPDPQPATETVSILGVVNTTAAQQGLRIDRLTSEINRLRIEDGTRFDLLEHRIPSTVREHVVNAAAAVILILGILTIIGVSLLLVSP